MKKEIQKQRAIELLKEGETVDYVARRYDKLGYNTVRALKAHLTMGTYNVDNYKGKMDLEKRTIVELLKFGVPEGMILAKCKGLKASNLHAYKAHITRGSYGK